MELAVGQREGRRRGSRVGSYWLLIGRPATNSLNYRLYFLASPPSASASRGTSSFSSVCLHLLRPAAVLSALLPPFLRSSSRSLFRSVSRPLFRFRPESSEKSSVDLITRNNPRGCEACLPACLLACLHACLLEPESTCALRNFLKRRESFFFRLD